MTPKEKAEWLSNQFYIIGVNRFVCYDLALICIKHIKDEVYFYSADIGLDFRYLNEVEKELYLAIERMNADNQQINIDGGMHWFSVSDNLPPVEKSVLVYDGFGVYISNRLDENRIVWDESKQILDEVTHWQLLPNPPSTTPTGA